MDSQGCSRNHHLRCSLPVRPRATCSAAKCILMLSKLFSHVFPAAKNCKQLAPVLTPYKRLFSKYKFTWFRSYMKKLIRSSQLESPVWVCMDLCVERVHTHTVTLCISSAALSAKGKLITCGGERILFKPQSQLRHRDQFTQFKHKTGNNLSAQFWFLLIVVCAFMP